MVLHIFNESLTHINESFYFVNNESFLMNNEPCLEGVFNIILLCIVDFLFCPIDVNTSDGGHVPFELLQCISKSVRLRLLCMSFTFHLKDSRLNLVFP